MSGEGDRAAGPEALLALTPARVAELAGISLRRLTYWQQQGLFEPGLQRQLGRRSTVRLYRFTDALQVLVAAQLRDQLSLQHIRKVIDHLRASGYSQPLSELPFAVVGRELYVQHPNGSWEGGLRPDQIVLHQVLHLQPLRARLARAGEREPAQVGRVERRRGRQGAREVFAGTRIPVDTVRRYLARGYTPLQIVEAYPSLTVEDVTAVQAGRAAS